VPSDSQIIVAAAGGGKTTHLVRDVLARPGERIALVTYTLNNVDEIEQKFYTEAAHVPGNVEISPWVTFLLREMARPYQRALHGPRIEGMTFVGGRSTDRIAKTDVRRFYFSSPHRIYSDKLSQFICAVDDATGGAVMARLKQRFDAVYLDEVQDVAGYDLDVIERMLKVGIRVVLIGDHRQATFRTNYSGRHAGYGGYGIIKKLEEWAAAKLASLEYANDSHRYNQAIANFASTIFPDDPKITSLRNDGSDHDGVFIVRPDLVAGYVARFKPQVLRYTKATDCVGHTAMNYGVSKGRTFERVLVFPHKAACKWLETADLKHIKAVASHMYVGVTRAKHSLAYVHDGKCAFADVTTYET